MLLPPLYVGPDEFSSFVHGEVEEVGISVATFWAFFQRSNPDGEAWLNAIWSEIRTAIQSGALAEDILADYIDRLETAATRGWRQRVLERDMEFIGFAERHRREGHEQGLREGIEKGAQMGALDATLKLAEQLAPDLVDELRDLDDADKAQKRLAAYLKDKRG